MEYDSIQFKQPLLNLNAIHQLLEKTAQAHCISSQELLYKTVKKSFSLLKKTIKKIQPSCCSSNKSSLTLFPL